MIDATHILAADQMASDAVVKLIMGVVVAGFWIVTQVIGNKTKKPDRRLPPSLPTPREGRLPPVPPSTPAGRLNKPQRAPSGGGRGGSMYKRPPAMPPRSAPIATRPLAAPQVQRREPLGEEYHGIAAPISRSLRDTSDGKKNVKAAGEPILDRSEFLGALLKPRNLRKAYILNELLQPPVALRADRE